MHAEMYVIDCVASMACRICTLLYSQDFNRRGGGGGGGTQSPPPPPPLKISQHIAS